MMARRWAKPKGWRLRSEIGLVKPKARRLGSPTQRATNLGSRLERPRVMRWRTATMRDWRLETQMATRTPTVTGSVTPMVKPMARR